MLEKEIKAHYKELHDTLSADYYAGESGLAKEEFDFQHGQIWSAMEAELIAEGYLKPPEPPRHLDTEIDGIKDRLKALEDASKSTRA